MKTTFKGGIRLKNKKKRTFASPIERISGAPEMVFPLRQNAGAELYPLVGVGDKVYVNQKIADNKDAIAVPIHSSVSGRVIAIEERDYSDGSKRNAIIIENDNKDMELFNKSELPEIQDVNELTNQEFIDIVREAGISGMGGGAFPTYAKIEKCIDKEIDFLIINGAECEPYITADHRAMVEYPRQILGGVVLLMKILKPKQTFVAVEDNKDDAVFTLKTVVQSMEIDIKIKEIVTKYPQGSEKQLIKAIAKREIPPGALPADVGCMVFNVDTCAAIYRAVHQRHPVIMRVVTVSGSAIKKPKNLLARIGTPIEYLIECCGGFETEPAKIIIGGPMMGTAQHSISVPITKGASAVLALVEKDYYFEKNPVCIRCGKCISVCPVRLMPVYICMYADRHDFRKCEELNVNDCIECGACSYICPGRMHLVSSARLAKFSVKQMIKERGGNNE